MDFEEKEFSVFVEKFGGSFMNLIPDNIPVYEKDDTCYILGSKAETLKLIGDSLKNNFNFLLSNAIYSYSEDDFV